MDGDFNLEIVSRSTVECIDFNRRKEVLRPCHDARSERSIASTEIIESTNV